MAAPASVVAAEIRAGNGRTHSAEPPPIWNLLLGCTENRTGWAFIATPSSIFSSGSAMPTPSSLPSPPEPSAPGGKTHPVPQGSPPVSPLTRVIKPPTEGSGYGKAPIGSHVPNIRQATAGERCVSAGSGRLWRVWSNRGDSPEGASIVAITRVPWNHTAATALPVTKTTTRAAWIPIHECATAEYSLVDSGPTVYYVLFAGCIDGLENCCPFIPRVTNKVKAETARDLLAQDRVLAATTRTDGCVGGYTSISRQCCPR